MGSSLQLDTLFTVGARLDDRDGDGLPDALRTRIVVGSRAQLPEHLAAVDLAARLGFASLALELPLVCSDRDPLPASIIPLFVGRPTTVAPTCPARLTGLLAGLQQGEGLVAVENGPELALLVGGSDPAGLAVATHAATAWLLLHVDDYDPDDPGQSHGALAGFPGEHPGVTTASLITEVADETAQGRHMARCAHAHLVADRVLLDYLFDVNAPAMIQHERRLLPGGTVLLRAVRPRPALAGPIPSADLPGTPTP